MLNYLDALIDALSLRDCAEVTRLLAHPLSRILPATVRDEANSLVDGRCDALAAPLRLMQLRHQTAELLRDSPPVADVADESTDSWVEVADASRVHRPHARANAPANAPANVPAKAPANVPARAHRPPRMVQMELPLSA